MPQWGRNDNAANSVLWAPAQLNKAPTRTIANTLYGNTTSGGFITGRTDSMVGADDAEAVANPGLAHAGWHLKTTGSGGRAGRVIYETLVAMSSMTGDGDSGTLVDFIIRILTQPVDTDITDGEDGTIDVVADTLPAGQTITYQWQIDATANGDWQDLSDATFYSNTDTTQLYITAANSTIDGALFRVVLSGSDAANVTSDPAALTVS